MLCYNYFKIFRQRAPKPSQQKPVDLVFLHCDLQESRSQSPDQPSYCAAVMFWKYLMILSRKYMMPLRDL